MALLYAHPERQPTAPPPDPAIIAKQQTLGRRLMGPPRDEAFESHLRDVHVPVLMLFGTLDRIIPSEMGRLYCEKLPNCALVLVYDAGHAWRLTGLRRLFPWSTTSHSTGRDSWSAGRVG